jgi:serine/threonine protein kinase
MSRWTTVTPSQFAHEKAALDYIENLLPDREPYRAWSNFEFVGEDASINEVDLLVVSRYTVFLVEIKSWHGEIGGDAYGWRLKDGGRTTVCDNPLLLTNRKAKKFASLLRRQFAAQKKSSPYVQPLVFLSDATVHCTLRGPARENICTRADIRERLFDEKPPVSSARLVDGKAVARFMEKFKSRSRAERKVGNYVLEKLLVETDYYQDWLVPHPNFPGRERRVRVYTIKESFSPEQREMLRNAAKREFLLLEEVTHPGIVHAVEYTDSDNGPALIFKYDAKAQRLDHFLAEKGQRLDFAHRLKLIRAIAEVLDAAHRNGIYHRGLSPQTILVRNPQVDASSYDVAIFDWQIATKQIKDTEAAATVTLHAELVSDPLTQSVYMAPEAQTAARPNPQRLDVFSLGAIAYYVLSDRAPAVDVTDLYVKCDDGPGLLLSAVVDACLPQAEEVVQYATLLDAGKRTDSVQTFLAELTHVEDEYQRALAVPAEQPAPLLEANADWKNYGFTCTQRLGRGSTSLALKVEQDGSGKTGVLKVALEADFNHSLAREAQTLARLDHPNIVRCFDRYEFEGLAVLFLSFAGDETLGARLREQGRQGLTFLQRFGEELLDVVRYLEKMSVAHRDIKPDNIGIGLDAKKRLTLTLFDFSLAGVSDDNVTAGTRVYMDPFLRKRGHWDGFAERYSAALTLYETATGKLPQWGDGSVDPGAFKGEITLDPELFDASVRQAAQEFFARAFRRDHRKRFQSGEEMLREWKKVFECVTRPTATYTTQLPLTADAEADEFAGVAADTPVAALGFDPRHLELLERLGLGTAGELADVPRNRLYRNKGIALAVARELHQRADALRRKFSGRDVEEEADAADTRIAHMSVDAVAVELAPSKGDEAHIAAVRDWLGLDAPSSGVALTEDALDAAAERIKRQPEITYLRADVADILAGLGGVATVKEIADALLARRGSVRNDNAQRNREALAVARAAVVVELRLEEPRWHPPVRRDSLPRPLTQPAQEDDLLVLARIPDGAPIPAAAAPRCAGYVDMLGRAADMLAERDPLPSPQQVEKSLNAIALPEGVPPLAFARRLRLAALFAKTAALSAQGEFYPRAMAAERAIKLAANSLLGLQEFDRASVERRIKSRYPHAGELPQDPAELERLLVAAGLAVKWDGDRARFVTQFSAGVTSGSTHYTLDARPLTAPDAQQCRQIDLLITQALQKGRLFTLSVDPRYMSRAAELLMSRFGLELIDVDDVVLRELEAFAAENRIDWSVLLAADAASPHSVDADNFATVLKEVWPRIEARLRTGARPGLLVNLGLLARWQKTKLFADLYDDCLRGKRAALVALVAGPMTAGGAPVLDNVAVPVAIGDANYAYLPSAWLAEPDKEKAPQT